MRPAFIGIDLAWSPLHPSGLAALVPGRASGELAVAALGNETSDADVVAFVGQHAPGPAVVLVDAPLVVPNASGTRACDREATRRFGARHAGVYPANRRLLGRWNDGVPRGEALARALEGLGFAGPGRMLPPAGPLATRTVHECHPHAGAVELFGLERVLKYKKKRQSWASARAALARGVAMLAALTKPTLTLDDATRAALDPAGLVGRAYKACEDRFDALLCAYLAALVPPGRLEPLGDPREGAIVVPRPTAPAGG